MSTHDGNGRAGDAATRDGMKPSLPPVPSVPSGPSAPSDPWMPSDPLPRPPAAPASPHAGAGPVLLDEAAVKALADSMFAEAFRPPDAAGAHDAPPPPPSSVPGESLPWGAPPEPVPACASEADVATALAEASEHVPSVYEQEERAAPPRDARGAQSPAPAAALPGWMPFAPPIEPVLEAATLGRTPSPGAFYFLPPPPLDSPTREPATASAATAARPRARPSLSESPAGAGGILAARDDFPALDQRVNGHPLVWLDNAATTQKPRAVIEAISRFYERDNSNIHRGAHTLARRATQAYEDAREAVRRFLGAPAPEEVVFVRGTTEAINLVAQTWGRQNVGPGDEILLTTLEHHANIVPWQMLAREKGARLVVAPITDRGEIVMEEWARLLSPRTRLAACTQVSNALGTVLPVREMAEMAHRRGALVLVDGAQSVPHVRVDVADLGADFFAFSGHKVYGPAGVGVLWARRALLEEMPPWQGGGSMIRTVTFETTTYSDPPAKFEAGTPTIADAVGLGAAVSYLERLGIDGVARHEHELLEYGTRRLGEVPGLRLVGTAPDKASVLSFVIEGTRPEDVGRHLDAEGIAVRAGHHCAMPTMQRFGLTGTVRPSLGLYNTREDVDALVEALLRFRRG